jgi:S1-C subfamily serine protease
MRRAVPVLVGLFLALVAQAATAQTLKRVREEFAAIGEKGIPATVIVRSLDVLKPFERFIVGSSAVIVSADGYILSDADSTLKGFELDEKGQSTGKKIHGVDALVRLPAPDLRTFRAVLIRRDADTDSSLLKIDEPIKGKLPYLPLGVSSNLQVCDFGIVLGNAFGMSRETEPALSLGVIAALEPRSERKGGRFQKIHVTAAVNNGNNGGPFLNSLGRVVGIVSSFDQDPLSPYRPLGFITPIDLIRPAYEDLDCYGKIFPPMTKRPMRSDDAAVLEEAFGIVGKHVAPAIVSIEVKRADDAETTIPTPRMDPRTRRVARGADGKPVIDAIPRFPGPYSGVVISADGYILTSTKNLWEFGKIEAITVHLPNGLTPTAKILSRDRFRDVAMIKVEATGLKAIEFATEEDLKVGRFALAFGNPYGKAPRDLPLFSAGVVSGLNRTGQALRSRQSVTGLIQTDAAMTDGMIGGALVTLDGKLMGISQIVDTQAYGRNSGIGFAAPMHVLLPGLADLKAGKSVEPGYLGINTSQDRAGRIVLGVIAKAGPAEKAGLKKGDILLGVDGTPASSYETTQELYAFFQTKRPGETLIFKVKRGTVEKEIPIVLGSRPGD